jgi:hypothetical protein
MLSSYEFVYVISLCIESRIITNSVRQLQVSGATGNSAAECGATTGGAAVVAAAPGTVGLGVVYTKGQTDVRLCLPQLCGATDSGAAALQRQCAWHGIYVCNARRGRHGNKLRPKFYKKSQATHALETFQNALDTFHDKVHEMF